MEEQSKKHVNIRVHGQVQGVFFRQNAQEQAERLGLNGFARNEPDGSVYIEAEGGESALEEFKNWCQYGSEIAQVEKVETNESDFKGYSGFDIR